MPDPPTAARWGRRHDHLGKQQKLDWNFLHQLAELVIIIHGYWRTSAIICKIIGVSAEGMRRY